jgi:UDPglucose 6-dehydrogenase
VGLLSAVCFAKIGNNIVCVDKDENKIELLNNLKSPIYEPDLYELIEKNIREDFSTDIRFKY